MLPPIKIDLSELQREFALKQAQVEDLGATIASNITDRIFHNWRKAAMDGLKSTRKLYIQNLQIGEISPTKKYIFLSGVFLNMIEAGFSAFDMKPGFLNSRKVKHTKKGSPYITIPFRWATPGALGESEIFANVMPREIYAQVRRNQSTITSPVNGTISRGKSNYILPSNLKITDLRPSFSDIKNRTTFPEYTHKGSIYEGIVRNEKTYEKATQGSYVSFRRVSEQSDMMSWIHKAQEGKNFAKKAIDSTNVAFITDRTIDAFLSEAGF